jgi:hypothetical protein
MIGVHLEAGTAKAKAQQEKLNCRGRKSAQAYQRSAPVAETGGRRVNH